MENEKHGSDNAENRRHVARWLSQGLEDLLAALGRRDSIPSDKYDFDVVIVGSGYGGAMAAAQLAGRVDRETRKPIRLCVLERGREYLSGMFPVSEAQLPGHIRISTADRAKTRGKADGLLDLRVGPDVCALLANGLGGGSLINAGVMARPTEAVLNSEAWPKELRTGNALANYYSDAERLLTPAKGSELSKFGKSRNDPVPLKFEALSQLGGNGFTSAPLSISIDGGKNSADVELRKCIGCGDCATGCNHQAKNSLDQNCLVTARRNRAEIYCGATVLRLERLAEERPGWKLHVVHTDPDLRRRGKTCELSARRVILAAGTFGSTEILLRSRSAALGFSRSLGQRFSTNGDLLAVAYNQKKTVNAVALETDPFDERRIGPTITGMIDRRNETDGIAIQEFAIPGALRRLFAESFTLAHTFYGLAQPGDRHLRGSGDPDPCGVSQPAIEKTQVFGLMGDDGAAGTLALVPGCSDDSGDGAIRVHWSALRTDSGTTVFDKQVEVLRKLVRDSGQGGEVLPNPIWRLLPPDLESIVDIPRGPALTVHPLGGCSMADDSRYGVVDHCGRVFNPVSDFPGGHHDGLVVLDGSVIPCALGINPALTIAAVALRALEALREEWLAPSEPLANAEFDPVLPPLSDIKVPGCIPTQIRILERMKGEVSLKLEGGKPEKRVVELTIGFRPHKLNELSGSLTRQLEIDESSRIRIFDPDCYDELWRTGASEVRFDQSAKFIAPLTGHMLLLDRDASTVRVRAVRALWAWFLNRGTRDLWQKFISERSRDSKKGSSERVAALIIGDQFRLTLGQVRATLCRIVKSLRQFWRFASHAGETRLFEYELTIGKPEEGASPAAIARVPERYRALMADRRIRGVKRLTYSIACNPWRQLMELELTDFPNLLPRSARVLELEPKYYARQEKHLLEIVAQRDHATALFELASFLFCVLRILLTTHIWSFRLPDAPSAAKPRRLPGRLPGLPEPEINEIEVGAADTPARIRLTRYARTGAKPVVLIHGFSANGTTFAHPALRPSLASYLWEGGRDVWILDLRTSSGMPTSRGKWTFEDVAGADIPAAFVFIQGATQKPKIDVVTQCMGAAMLSMAILDKDGRCTMDASDREWLQAREVFLESIGSVVLSQIAPMIVFSPANVYRAYVVSYVQHALEDRTFELRPDEGLTSQLLDRLLASVPYPKGEFRIEHPLTPWKRTPFVGTRHRMDAWFGRVLNLENVDLSVLEHIDDMFGTINLRTTFQTIHFARNGMITTEHGRNAFVTPTTLRCLKNIPILSIHGKANGLADVATVTRMHMLMDSIKGKYHSLLIDGLGHQDCMIGRDAGEKIFPQLLGFLDDPDRYESPSLRPSTGAHGGAGTQRGPVAEVPWLGPILGERAEGHWKIAVAPNPKLAQPTAVTIVPVKEEDGRWRMHGELSDKNFIRVTQPIFCGTHPEDDHRWYEARLAADWYETDHVLIVLVYDQAPVVGKPPYSDRTDEELWALPAEITRPEIKRAITTYLNDVPPAELEGGLMTRPREGRDEHQPLRFAAGSCQYPAGPLDPTLAGASYARLHDLLDQPNPPEFLVLSGDQVYVDATNGLMDPSTGDDRYELPYEKFLRAPPVRRVLKRLPAYTMLDDHEIENNWEPGVQDTGKIDKNLNDGKEAYLKFQRVLNSPQLPIWYQKPLRGFPFFFADTRTERKARSAPDIDNARIMDDPQFKELTEWLTKHKDDRVPIFVGSPSILLPRHLVTTCSNASALSSDAWDGFPYSFRRLLAHIAREQIHNVVFLSGDEHHSCVARAALTPLHAGSSVARGPEVIIHSIHSSALYAPYVFANGTRADLAGEETFGFDDPDTSRGRYEISCKVQTKFPSRPGNGFAVIECARAAPDRWSLQCNFHPPDGIEPMSPCDIFVAGSSGIGERPHAA